VNDNLSELLPFNPIKGPLVSAFLYIGNMNLTHKATLLVTFVVSFFIQPNWFFDNFWAKADFYDSIPFTVPFVAYSLVSAILGTLACEGVIRFVKKYL
jgi:hypothetical protein